MKKKRKAKTVIKGAAEEKIRAMMKIERLKA